MIEAQGRAFFFFSPPSILLFSCLLLSFFPSLPREIFWRRERQSRLGGGKCGQDAPSADFSGSGLVGDTFLQRRSIQPRARDA